MTEFLSKSCKRKTHLSVGLIILATIAFPPCIVRGSLDGPPPIGDWVVAGTEGYSDQSIVLNGNLVVENGGDLTLRRIDLKLNCSYDGQYGIEVKSGGNLYVLEDSVISSVTSGLGFSFFVYQDSIFRMSDSELHECGWDHWGTDGKPTGLNIFSDGAVIENNLMSHNFYNIFVHSSDVVIRNNNITANEQGIKVAAEVNNVTVHSNQISSNGLGIALDGGDITISGNTITSNTGTGICSGRPLDGAAPVIVDNFITNNTLGIELRYSRAVVTNNTIAENLAVGIESYDYDNSTISRNIIALNHDCGINCHDNSGSIIRNNTLTGNEDGINCRDSNLTIQNNTITGSGGYSIRCENSNSTIQDNILSSNQNGIGLWSTNSLPQSTLILHNDIFSNTANGIHVFTTGATIQQNNITANGWGIVMDHSNSSIQWNSITENNEGGIMANFDCSPLIEGNYISRHTRNIGSGIAFKPNCTGVVQGNFIADNQRGIELHEHCSPIIQGNKVTNNYFEGILLEHYCNPTIQGNMIQQNGEGGLSDGILCHDKSNPQIHNNDICSNTGCGLVNSDASITIDARENYWGSPTGPVHQSPDVTDPEEISGNILYDSWLTERILVLEITDPLADETVSATVTVSANVKSRNDVRMVEFYLDGLEYTDFDWPYEWSWDTTQYAEAYQTITILALDKFGLDAKASRTVFVDNTAPVVLFKEPDSGITHYGMVTIMVNATDNREVDSVRVRADDGAWWIMTYNTTSFLWECDFNTTTLSDGQHTLMSLVLDKAANPTTKSMTMLTDNTPPSLTIQHPQSGTTVGLTLTVMVQANDMSGISKIEFYLANTLVNTLTTLPYQWAWDTTKYPNGAYIIVVEAYDTIGNIVSRETTVTVNNVEVPWLQANLLTIIQVAIGLGGLAIAVVTYWSRTKDKRKKTSGERETTSGSAHENSGQEVD